MRFTVPFLMAIAVFTATVLGANQTSFTPNEDMLYDIVSASDAIGFRLERVLGVGEKASLFIGAVLLTLPALFAFHIFRIGFGGAVHAIVAEREEAGVRREEALRYRQHVAIHGREATERARRRNTRPKARKPVVPAETDGVEQMARGTRDEKPKERGSLGANIAAAFARRDTQGVDDKTTTGDSARATSGMTSLGNGRSGQDNGNAPKDERPGLRDRWGKLLDNKPDFSNLKSQAQGIRERLKRPSKPVSELTDLNKD